MPFDPRRPVREFMARSYLVTALAGLARQPCHRSNCGSVCLCEPCAARYVLAYYGAKLDKLPH